MKSVRVLGFIMFLSFTGYQTVSACTITAECQRLHTALMSWADAEVSGGRAGTQRAELYRPEGPNNVNHRFTQDALNRFAGQHVNDIETVIRQANQASVEADAAIRRFMSLGADTPPSALAQAAKGVDEAVTKASALYDFVNGRTQGPTGGLSGHGIFNSDIARPQKWFEKTTSIKSVHPRSGYVFKDLVREYGEAKAVKLALWVESFKEGGNRYIRMEREAASRFGDDYARRQAQTLDTLEEALSSRAGPATATAARSSGFWRNLFRGARSAF